MSENHLDVTVEGLPVKALVDSSTSSLVVSEKFRQYLTKVMFPAHNHTVLKVANGSYEQLKGICMLQIGISGRILPFEFIVLPDCSNDIILGWNFLKASGALIDCGGSELTLDDVEVSSEDIVFKALCLCAMTDCRLPAYLIRKIPALNHCTEDSGNVIVKGSKLSALKKEVFMPSMLVTVRRSKTEIWVFNCQSQEKVIPQVMCVAFAEPFCPDCIATISETSRVRTEISETKQSFEFLKMISPDLDVNQKRMLETCYRSIQKHLRREKNGTPQITVKHRINTGDNLPVKQRAYRVSPAEHRIIHDEVGKMLDRGIIQPSESPSPVILVRKKDYTWRYCVDYRWLNRITKKDVYPLPRVDDRYT
ncbi:retrovirus-related Pol polyprotein from transposon 297 [Trichonephila clavipes]|nr:retrovirus-related Pol polyprotein from transposon 297 [Trichonephila clavipes]